jgi:hypothetical protein
MKLSFPASLRVIGRSSVDWWDGWLDFVQLSIVWLFAQLTIVLGPPATFGVYYVVHQMLNGEALGVRGMIAGARKYFWKSLAWGLLNLVVLFTAVVNYEFYGAVQAAWGPVVRAFVVMLTLLWLSTQFYALPYFMELEVPRLRTALKNGFLTTLAAPLFSFILLIFAFIIMVASFGFILPVFLGLPGLIPVLGVNAMYDRLIAFGLKKPDKTPKQIEYEQGSKLNIPALDRLNGGDAGSPPGGQIAQEEGQVKQEE